MSCGTDSVVDACCVLDLYAAWDGLDPLEHLYGNWHVAQQAIREVQYLRNDFDGERVLQPIDLGGYLRDGIVRPCEVRDAEFESYVEFAGQLGDGEAASLAIAHHRGWVLATDDGKALRIAQEVGVATITTPRVLEDWAVQFAVPDGELAAVLRNVERRARYHPKPGSTHYEWWVAKRQ